MYTQCSHCDTIFRVSMKEITAAQGKLRCGECGQVFDAMDTLSSTLPAGLEQNMLVKEQTMPTPVLSRSKKAKIESTTAAKSSLTPSQDRARTYMFWVGVGLILFLLLQALYVSRNWLAHQPATAHMTRSLCKTLGCTITPQRDPTKIEVVSRNVYAHPNEPGSLIIAATMHNVSPFEQPLPLIEVSFLNKNNDTIALRRFRPEEYTAKNRENKDLFNPDETITFKLKIADPGSEAVTFQFNFL